MILEEIAEMLLGRRLRLSEVVDLRTWYNAEAGRPDEKAVHAISRLTGVGKDAITDTMDRLTGVETL